MDKREYRKHKRAHTKYSEKAKLSRKDKLLLFGRRPSAAAIRKKIRRLKIIKRPYALYEDYELEGADELFCPNCGCEEMDSTGNMTCHPEYWEYFYCMRCGMRVGKIDNSPFVHILAEMKCEEAS